MKKTIAMACDHAALDLKADSATVNEALATKVDATVFDEAIALKADAATVTELSESINTSLSEKANSADVTTALDGKADAAHTHNYIHIGEEAPTDESVVLWIHPTEGLKYYNDGAWVNIPTATI